MKFLWFNMHGKCSVKRMSVPIQSLQEAVMYCDPPKQRGPPVPSPIKSRTFICMWGLEDRAYLVRPFNLKGLISIEKSLLSSDLGKSCGKSQLAIRGKRKLRLLASLTVGNGVSGNVSEIAII